MLVCWRDFTSWHARESLPEEVRQVPADAAEKNEFRSGFQRKRHACVLDVYFVYICLCVIGTLMFERRFSSQYPGERLPEEVHRLPDDAAVTTIFFGGGFSGRGMLVCFVGAPKGVIHDS